MDIKILDANFANSDEYANAKQYKSINFGYFDNKEKAIQFVQKVLDQFHSKDGFGIAKLESGNYYAFCGVDI